MIPRAEAIRRSLAGRVRLEALYLCGPFDSKGEPASPDIHVLALSHDDALTDLHFVPGSAAFERRVEVSVAPFGMVEASQAMGVGSWLAFYTIDKIARGKPMLESPEALKVREALAEGVKFRPSVYAGTMANLRNVRLKIDSSPGQAEGLIKANLVLLLTYCLYSVIHLKRTFSRNSELLTQTRHMRGARSTSRPAAEAVLESGRRFLVRALRQTGFDIDAVAATHLRSVRRGEKR